MDAHNNVLNNDSQKRRFARLQTPVPDHERILAVAFETA